MCYKDENFGITVCHNQGYLIGMSVIKHYTKHRPNKQELKLPYITLNARGYYTCLPDSSQSKLTWSFSSSLAGPKFPP